ncbi:uncharacterized protein [Primulina eburnea]|uniref:uncharacterized protein n=1 Tax=Primulina eburnea TaxID=1245227 RepID=UPI003C6BECA1
MTNCTSAKNAWDTLQRHCEGSESVRRTRLRMITSKFEMMRMEESEKILDYDRRLREIANEAFSLGDPISNERLVSKVFRSLPERFNVKICAIDETKDTSQMALEDLISSLRTFEMNMDMQKKDNGKTIAFQVSNDSYNDLLQISQEVNESDLCEDSITYITKKLGDYLRRIRDKNKSEQPSRFPSLPAPERPQNFPAQQQFRPRNEGKGQYNSKKYDSVQCRECNGFGRYANECANRLRKNKGYNVSLSNEESNEEEKSNDENNHTSLNALLIEKCWLQVNPLGVATPRRNTCSESVCLKSTSFGDSSVDDDLEVDEVETTLESVQKLYEELYADWTKRNKLNSTLMKENTELKVVVAKLEVILRKKDLELGKTMDELQKATETLSKFNSSTSKIDSILLMGRDDKKGLGFKDSVFEIGKCSKSAVFVKGKVEASTKSQSILSIKSSPPRRQHAISVPKKRKCRYVCHYCYKLRDDCMKQKLRWMLPRMLSNISRNTSNRRPTVRQISVPKVKPCCNVVYTSLKTNTAGIWYFDSGSSRHMTGSREHLTDYVEQKSGRVTYGGGAKGKIVEKGTLNVEGLPTLHNVFHGEGLNSNLISISQLCDDNLYVKFDKHTCEVFDICIMTGTRSSDNCYQIGEEHTCKHAQVGELDLWYQKLGHVNFKTLRKLCKYDAVRGMPNLSSSTPYICRDCKKGKQTRVSHPVLPSSGTTRCLELLHMDLMSPMEVESFGGKKYSLVCVDDFSRFSWISFIREKSDTFDVFKQLIVRITNFQILKVRRKKTEHGKEFENSSFSSFCDKKGISHEFSAPKTPQQNEIVERKNRTLQKMARMMLTSKCISKRFWAEALNIACHISNRVYLRIGSTMTSYDEIIMGKKPNLKYFHVFGCVCYVLNDMDQLTKFDSKSDKCLFLGYATNSRAYQMSNLRTRTIMEFINVVFDDHSDLKKKTVEDDVDDLLEISTSLENMDVAPDVATPNTTRDIEVTEPEDEK